MDGALVLAISLVPFYLGLFGEVFSSTHWTEPDDVGTLFVDGLLFVPVIALLGVQFIASGIFHGLIGQTPGKVLTRTRLVRKKDGGRPTLKRAFSRAGFSVVSLVLLGSGFLWLLLDRRQRALHDHFSGTIVVQS